MFLTPAVSMDPNPGQEGLKTKCFSLFSFYPLEVIEQKQSVIDARVEQAARNIMHLLICIFLWRAETCREENECERKKKRTIKESTC